ncbi:MAG: glycerophosphodiester phosphodiesterase family protein [Alphaproteobacteria bacterium]
MTTALLPRVVAHRGASAAAPENTLAALRYAAAMGARWAECDVRLAGDGTPVVIHDATLERTTDGRGAVGARGRAELARLDAGGWFDVAFAGERVPTLAVLLAAARRLGLGLNVEIKAEDEATARATAAAAAPLLGAWAGPLLVSSFHDGALAALRNIVPALGRGLLCHRRVGPAEIARAREIAAVSLHADRRAFDSFTVGRIEQAGLWPVAYTVNDPDEARGLWRCGVRTLITDRPDALIAAATA